MNEPLDPSTKLQRLRRRPLVGAPLPFLEHPQQDMFKALLMQPDEIALQVRRLAKLTQLFPTGALSSTFKAEARKLQVSELGSLLRTYARALRRCPEVTGVDPQKLLDLSRKLARYQILQQRSGRWANSAFDIQQVLGGLQMHLLSRVTRALVARLDAPGCTKQERERLENKFGKLLLHKELLMEDAQEQKTILARRRAELLAAAKEAERRTLLANVMAALKRGEPVDQQTLEAAADILHEQEQREREALGIPEKAGKDGRKTQR